jgi:hypothetical protein
VVGFNKKTGLDCEAMGIQYELESSFTLLYPGEPGSSVSAIGKGAFPNFFIEELSDDPHVRLIAVVRNLRRKRKPNLGMEW